MKKLISKSFFIIVLLAFSLLFAGCSAQNGSKASGTADTNAATDYPNKPITFVQGYSPGGSVDITGKIICEMLKEKLGQPVVAEYKAGAAQAVAASYVKKASPDGYTLFWRAEDDFIGMMLLNAKDIDFTLDDFDEIGGTASGPYFLVVNSKSPWKSLEELIADAKKNPGKLTYSSSGMGSIQNVTQEMLAKEAGVKFTHVPAQGGGPALTELVGGHVDMHIASVGRVKSHIEAGTLRPMAVLSDERYQGLPDVPTITEKGYKTKAIVYHDLVAPKGLPEPVLAKLRKAFEDGLKDPKYAEMLEKTLYSPKLFSADATKKMLKDDMAAMKPIVTDLGLVK
jgi:tripartite-type tricarboxylate transporter receptor subunit TctC